MSKKAKPANRKDKFRSTCANCTKLIFWAREGLLGKDEWRHTDTEEVKC